MNVLTFTTLAAMLLGLVARRGYGWSLAIGAATPSGACLIAGPVVIPTFYGVGMGAVVIAVGAAVLTRPGVARDRRTTPALPLLLAFVVYALLVTLIAPQLFDGIRIVTPTTRSLVAGSITSSNLAQMAYLVIGVGVVAYLARARRADASILGLAVGLTIYVSGWRYLHTQFGFPFPDGLFDNSPSFLFIQTAPGGAERFRGIFSEPAALAASCLVAIVYFLLRMPRLAGGRRVLAGVTVALAAYLGVISTSTTFVIGAIVLLAIAAAVSVLGFFSRRYSMSTAAGLIGCVLVVGAVWVLPTVTAFVSGEILTKVAGDSFDERSGSDADSYRVFLDTWGVGVGVGAGRGSSILPTLLSTVGLLGVLLLSAAVFLLLRRAGGSPALRPVAWSLVAILVAKLIAGADLADPSGQLWICFGLLAHGALESDRHRGRAIRRAALQPGRAA